MSLFSYEEETLFWRWMEEAAYEEDMWDPSVREEQKSARVCASVRVSNTSGEEPPF